jgi:hypothetical protein
MSALVVAPGFPIGAFNDMPSLIAVPEFPIGSFNDRVWPEKTNEA